MTEARRVHLLVAGDVIDSAGTRSYLREMIRHLRLAGCEARVHLFQFRLGADMPAGRHRPADFDEDVYVAPGRALFAGGPRWLYRLYERWRLWVFFRRQLRAVGAGDALIAAGCLGALHLCGRRLPADAWWLKLGLIEEEGTRGLRYRVRKLIEARHARRFANRIVVSEPMGRFVADAYGEAAGEQLVLPCLVDLERFPAVDRGALRRKLGLGERPVVAYVGTAAPWQCAAETVALFERLLAREPAALLWVFTPDGARFTALLSHLPASAWRVEFRPHRELAGLLAAADAGCLLRRRSVVNRVASPLKFAEYLACGLPVLIGPEVGQYSGLVQDRGLGVVVDPDRQDDWPDAVERLRTMLADRNLAGRCRGAAEALSWQAFVPELARIFARRGDDIREGDQGART